MASHRFAAALALTGAIAGFACLPLLALPIVPSAPPCSGDSAEGTSILGQATLDAEQLRAWWQSTGRAQPERLDVDIGELIALYVSEGELEGVRGDIAFAQAILETGHFTNGDTARNNFAGIGHYDDAPAGTEFTSVAVGVRAHIQLLHKYAAGNDAGLQRPDVSPDAGAHANTWQQLAGTWATDLAYAEAIESTYASMLESAAIGDAEGLVVPGPGCHPGGEDVGGYALPVDSSWYDEHPVWFTKPHHDYPAADIPVPTGTPVYAISAGTVAATPTSGRCGTGVVINGDDGAQYTYCHGGVGTVVLRVGETVLAGQQVMLSASTGNSTGPHLHLGVRVDGENRCPQPMLVAIAESAPVDPRTLPASGCTS